MFLGIEIGGTKLQLGVGADDGRLRGLWRGTVEASAGAEGIQRQIVEALPELLTQSKVDRSALRGVGIGFGGPVDDRTKSVIRSHHIAGWDGFPLADWVTDLVGLPAVLGNDADVAGLAEALHGAGKGLSPIFYITVGTGIGGGLIVEGEIYRGVGRGAAEIGHLYIQGGREVVSIESVSSGRAIERMAAGIHNRPVTAAQYAEMARNGDDHAAANLSDAWGALAQGICHVITLLCPRRIVIGGGISLMGEDLFFAPLRQHVGYWVFDAFRGLTDIVPAALGEEVVIHGAIALARKKLS